MKHFSLLFLSISLTTTAFSQFKEIKDPAEGVDLETFGSMGKDEGQDNWVIYKDQLYFIAMSKVTDASIYKTDGTSEGTTLAINLPDQSIVVTGLAVAGDKLFFLANDGFVSETGALYLYVSDGTQGSVKRLGSMEVFGPHIGTAVAWNGILYFTARDADHGYEVWRSDGTESGTFRLKDIYPGSASSAPFDKPFNFYANDNYLFFTARNDHDIELWRTDGTGNGTIRLTDIPLNHSIQNTAASNSSTLYFVIFNGTGYDLWSSDGTVDGTSLLKDDAGAIISVGTWNDKVLYSTLSDELFTIDETNEPVKIADVQGNVKAGVEFKGAFYFLNGLDLWTTDGTEEGTRKTNAITDGGYNGLGANSEFIVMISYESSKNRMWAYDGTTPDLTAISDEFVWDANPIAGNIGRLNTFNNIFFLPYDDGHHGVEPWISDGTAEGTSMLKDIESQPVMGANIVSLTAAGSKVFFTANDGVHGDEPWVTDGTHDGTMMIKDMNPGPNGSAQNLVHGNFATLNDIVVFATSQATEGPRVWRTDGTEEGTYSISDGNDSGTSILSESVEVGGYLYYDDGFGLWRTDGTVEGTEKLKDPASPGILNIGVLKQTTVVFMVGKTLWKSDGTEAGTVAIKELPILPSSFAQPAQLMFPFGDITLFVADNGSNGLEIWKTDGTSQGTQPLKTGVSRTTVPYFYAVIDGKAIFDIFNESNSVLWKTDGTTSGTTILKDLGEAANVQMPVGIDGSMSSFVVRQGDDQAMWQTDGTSDGTKKVYDLPTGFYATYGKPASSFDGRFFYPANSPATGWELWSTNIFATRPLGDLAQGTLGSFPSEVTSTPDNLFFVATDESERMKVWILDPDFVFIKDQTIDFTTIEDKTVDDPPFELTATSSSGLPITFEIVSGPATISGSTLTITGAGEVVVRASQAGNEEYYDASVEQTFDVGTPDGLEDGYNTVTVWPNPATGTLVITADRVFSIMAIRDVLGRDLMTVAIDKKETNIDVTNLPRGIYLLQLRTADNKTLVRKVVLK